MFLKQKLLMLVQKYRIVIRGTKNHERKLPNINLLVYIYCMFLALI